jgi:hypothetical protein
LFVLNLFFGFFAFPRFRLDVLLDLTFEVIGATHVDALDFACWPSINSNVFRHGAQVQSLSESEGTEKSTTNAFRLSSD